MEKIRSGDEVHPTAGETNERHKGRGGENCRFPKTSFFIRTK